MLQAWLTIRRICIQHHAICGASLVHLSALYLALICMGGHLAMLTLCWWGDCCWWRLFSQSFITMLMVLTTLMLPAQKVLTPSNCCMHSCDFWLLHGRWPYLAL